MDTHVCLRSGTALFVLCAASFAQSALAQTADAPRTSNVVKTGQSASTDQTSAPGDIIVTAQKRSESINKVGMSITAVGGGDLQLKQINSVADLVRIVPGFNYTPSAYGTPVLTLRGIGFYDTALGAAPTVSVYLDQVPLPLSSMAAGVNLDLERVEVLKGPQGTLFGQNATGGALNYIAAKPTDSFAAGGALTYGRFNRVEGDGFLSGPITDTLKARVAVSYDRSDDWQESYTRDASMGSRDFLTGRLIVDWKPTSRLSVSLVADGWRDKSDNQAAQLVQIVTTTASAALKSYPLPPRNDRAADWDPGLVLNRNNSFWQTAAHVDYKLSDFAQITSITAYEQLRRRSIVDADGTAIQNYGLFTPGHSRNFSQELRLAGDADRLHYVVGGNYAWDSIYDEADPFAMDSSYPFNAARATSDQRVKTVAAFANLDWKITDRLTLQGGARYTDQHRRFAGCTYDSGAGDFSAVVSSIASQRSGQTVTIPPGACLTLGSDYLPAVVRSTLQEHNVSWRGGVNWQVDPTALLYANISKGYKSGAFPTAGATFAVQLTPAKQESVLAYEAGFKLALLGRTLQLTGAAFYYDYRDKQFRGRLVDPIIGPQNALINVPKSRVAGAELQASWRPVRGLTFDVGATYVGSKILGDFVNYNALAQRAAMSGEQFPLTPKWQLTGDAAYDFPVSSSLNAFVGAGATYQARTNGGLGNIALFDIPAYALFDLRVGVHTSNDKWRLSATIKNVANKFYSTLINQSGPDAVIRYTGLPRTWAMTIAYRY